VKVQNGCAKIKTTNKEKRGVGETRNKAGHMQGSQVRVGFILQLGERQNVIGKGSHKAFAGS